jgi:hypothetical protein
MKSRNEILMAKGKKLLSWNLSYFPSGSSFEDAKYMSPGRSGDLSMYKSVCKVKWAG